MSNVNFAALKKSHNQNLDALRKQAIAQKGVSRDETYWEPTVDAAGNGSATLRLLPAPPNEDMPWVRYWDHIFKGIGGWYRELSRTTLGEEDPVSEYNQQLWATETEANKKIVRQQKRRLNYVMGVYVVKDKLNPDTEGKVYKFRAGKKIFDIIEEAMTPQNEGLEEGEEGWVEPINPFNFWEGANFVLNARDVDGYRNYDKSKFGAVGPIKSPSGKALTDKQIEEIWTSQYSLQDIISADKFKTYDVLKARMEKVLGLGAVAPSTVMPSADLDDEPRSAEPVDVPNSIDEADVDVSDDEPGIDVAALMERINAEAD